MVREVRRVGRGSRAFRVFKERKGRSGVAFGRFRGVRSVGRFCVDVRCVFYIFK